MSELGGTQSPPLPPTHEKKSSDEPFEVPVWAIAVAGLMALCLAAVAGFMILRQAGPEDPATGLPTSTPSFPAEWDKRIEPIANTAAKLRGLSFDHPVPVRFLSPAKFEKSLVGDEDELSKDDRAELEHVTGLLRALGLLTGDVDLQKAVSGFQGGAVLAYYSFDDDRITVRGKRITPSIKATLVHELTHVLQDQEFQIGGRLKALRKESEKGRSTNAASVLGAIVEGDAERVRYLYQASLTPKQRQVLTREQNRESAATRRRTADIPPLVVTQLSSPYVLGPGLVAALAADGGNSSVDTLLEKPPTHEAALFDPYRVVAGANGATKVPVPGLESDEKEFEAGDLGTLTWYFMLAAHLPLTQALLAADGWGGDSYVGYDRGDTTCAKLSFTGRSPGDTALMETALRQWAGAAPGEQTVTAEGKVVHVASCDPGTEVSGGADTSSDAMALLSVRNSLTGAFIQGQVPVAAAHCMANRLVGTYSVAQLSDPSFGTGDAAVRARVQQIAADCR